MSFMQPQIQQDTWLEVETRSGTQFVQAHFVKVPADLQLKETIDGDDRRFSVIAEQLEMYIEGKISNIQEITMLEGFGARFSAPGYMDCTEWSVFDTHEEAEEYLKEQTEYNCYDTE